MHLLGFSAVSDVGNQRSNNEDCYLCSPKHGLWIVADGMGGHAAGEVASAITINTTLDEMQKGNTLDQAIQTAHHAIIEGANNGVGGAGMGSTLVALHSYGENYAIAWVGDSRAYLWSDSKQSLTQITRDHSYVQMLYETGAIEKHEIDNHPEKNVITQCLGSIDLDQVKVSELEKKWQPGDKIILCSDGLNDAISNEAICEIIAKHSQPKAITRYLLDAALKAGGRDNITIIIINAPNAFQNFLHSLVNRIQKLLGKKR